MPLLLAMVNGIEPRGTPKSSRTPARSGHAIGAGGIVVMTVWGRNRAGRALVVVVRAADDSHDWLIIGASEMTDEQIQQFQRCEVDHEQ